MKKEMNCKFNARLFSLWFLRANVIFLQYTKSKVQMEAIRPSVGLVFAQYVEKQYGYSMITWIDWVLPLQLLKRKVPSVGHFHKLNPVETFKSLPNTPYTKRTQGTYLTKTILWLCKFVLGTVVSSEVFFFHGSHKHCAFSQGSHTLTTCLFSKPFVETLEDARFFMFLTILMHNPKAPVPKLTHH